MIEDNSIFPHIRQIHNLLNFLFGEDLKKWGLTFSQAHVLKALFDAGGQTTQKEIEKELGVSHPTVSGLIHRLEKNGFVESRTDDKDRRNKIISITDHALRHRSEVMENRAKTDAVYLSGFSPEEIHELDRLLDRLYKNMFDYKERLGIDSNRQS